MAVVVADSTMNARLEAVAGFAPRPIVFLAGGLATLPVFVAPCLLILLNLLVGTVFGGSTASFSAEASGNMMRSYLSALGPWLVPWVVFSGVLALLRQASIRSGASVSITLRGSQIEFGWHHLVSGLVVPFALFGLTNTWGIGNFVYVISFGILFSGLIYAQVFEIIHNWCLRLFARPDEGIVRSLEIREIIGTDEDLGWLEPHGVHVEWPERTAYIFGTYSNEGMPKRAREIVLARVAGIKDVRVVQPGEEGEAGFAPSVIIRRPGSSVPAQRAGGPRRYMG